MVKAGSSLEGLPAPQMALSLLRGACRCAPGELAPLAAGEG